MSSEGLEPAGLGRSQRFNDAEGESLTTEHTTSDIIRGRHQDVRTDQQQRAKWIGEQFVAFGDLSNWDNDQGTATVDINEQYKRMDAIRMESAGTPARIKYNFSQNQSFPLASYNWSIATKVDHVDGASATRVQLYLRDNNGNYARLYARGQPLHHGDWIRRDLGPDDIDSGFDEDNIVAAWVLASSRDSQQFWVQDLRVVENPFDRGAVIVSFDDNWAGDYEAFQIFSERGIPFHAVTVARYLDNPGDWPDRIDPALFREMYEDGMIVVNHGYNHDNVERDGVDAVVESTKKGQDWLENNGYHNSLDLHCYTNGQYSPEFIDEISKYHTMSAGVTGYPHPYLVSSPFGMQRAGFDNNGLSQVQDWLDMADQYNYVAHIYGHMDFVTEQDCRDIADYIRDQTDLRPITMKDLESNWQQFA